MLSQYKDGVDEQLSDLKETHTRKLQQLQCQIESLEVELKLEKEDVSRAAMVRGVGCVALPRGVALPKGCGTSQGLLMRACCCSRRTCLPSVLRALNSRTRNGKWAFMCVSWRWTSRDKWRRACVFVRSWTDVVKISLTRTLRREG